MTSIKEFFDEGIEILGEREGNYGDARPMFRSIVAMWNGYFKVIHPEIDWELTDLDGAVMLILFKIARAKGPGKKYTHDTGIDTINYAAIWAKNEEMTAAEIEAADKHEITYHTYAGKTAWETMHELQKHYDKIDDEDAKKFLENFQQDLEAFDGALQQHRDNLDTQ